MRTNGIPAAQQQGPTSAIAAKSDTGLGGMLPIQASFQTLLAKE